MKKDAILTGLVPDWDSPWRRVFPRHWNGLHIPRHLVFFDEKSLARTLERAGFSVERMLRVYDPGDAAVSASNWISDTFRLKTPSRQAWFYLPINMLLAPFEILRVFVFNGHSALSFAARKK
jgi:hypothetical protein